MWETELFSLLFGEKKSQEALIIVHNQVKILTHLMTEESKNVSISLSGLGFGRRLKVKLRIFTCTSHVMINVTMFLLL